VRRRLIAALASAALLTVLSGCALPLPIPKGPVKVSVPDGPLVAPSIGDCLEGMNGVDADWRSSVPCTDPHLYDIVAVAEWPGMADALDGRSAANVFADINDFAPSAFVQKYWAWAQEFCETATRDALAWGELDPRFDALHVMPAGGWGFDMSLATRVDFTAGEHRTLCSLGWHEEHATLPGMTVAEDFVADTTAATEECWVMGTAVTTPVDCAENHTDQSVLWFDARTAFGDAFLAPVDELDDADWDLASSMCVDLVFSVLPEVPESLGVWASIRYAELWDDLADAAPEPDAWYTMDCLLGSFDGERFTGDLFDGGTVGTEV
jgi:hypothetical protein